MICLINGMRHPDHYFWNCLHCLATETQMRRILDGQKLIIGETEYHLLSDDNDKEFVDVEVGSGEG